MKKYLITLLLLQAYFFSIAQGCSDAGFCTMGAMKPDQSYSKRLDLKLRSIEINAYRGSTTLTPVISVYTVDATIGVNAMNFFQIKLPYQTVKGNLGETSGMGDISLSWTRQLMNKERFSMSATLGAKIPSNNSDLERTDNKFGIGGDYPMYYQVSLGSYDFIAGTSIISQDWLFATGIQIPLTENQNDFRWGQWAEYPSDEYLRKHPLANNLKRGIDVMLRVERNFRFTNFNFSVGLLPIYRINKDERLDFNTGERIKIDKAQGLALSVLASAGYSFNVNHSVKYIFGKKITQRDINPDGLTRHEISSLSYIYRF